MVASGIGSKDNAADASSSLSLKQSSHYSRRPSFSTETSGAEKSLAPSEKEKRKWHDNRGVQAAVGSATGLANATKYTVKGLSLDIPLAVGEGLRNAPRLYGGEVYDPGRITDWKSGSVAASKNFAHGMIEGIGGIVMEPVRGAKKDGAMGALKGSGVGLLNFGTKTSSGLMGLMTMPSQGIYKSGRELLFRARAKLMVEATKEEGIFLTKNDLQNNEKKKAIKEAFDSVYWA